MATSIRTRAQLDKRGFWTTVRTYLELTKLRIVLLLLFTTVTAMIVAANGIPSPLIVIPTLLGGALSAGGASVINQYLDRDMDAQMSRTARRPIPSGRVKPINALLFGLGLIAWSSFILWVFVNPLTSLLALGGAVYYVVIYTMLLKRNTVLNILIGGGAGAMPVLVGWAAVTGSLSFEPFLLFAIIFYWTPPHSWALALLINKDYAAAKVPMMPVARGEAVTRQQIMWYSVQLVILTILPVLFGMFGAIYLLAAIALGGGLLYYAYQLIQKKDGAAAKKMYKYSTMYLAYLFMAMIIDVLLL
jgi:protoheme IX farnesyltransferase